MTAPILRRLHDLPDFEMADDSPDVRGWTVRGSEGHSLGTVYELIVDPEALKVRYLDIELDARFGRPEAERHILLPIGVAALDDDDDNVFVTALNSESILRYPPYVELQVTREYEEAMLRALGKLPASGDFYDRGSYDAGAFYGRSR